MATENGRLVAPLELCRQISDIHNDSGLLGWKKI
jgi:hypothetical protein